MDEQTGRALIDELRAIVRTARAATVPVEQGATAPASVISVLGLLDGQDGLRQGALARALGVDASVASRHVAAGTELGLLERRPDPVDGRACRLFLTPEGRRVLTERRAERIDWLGRVMADWDDADAAALLSGLRRLREDVVASVPPRPRPAGRSLAAAGPPAR